MTDLPTIDPTLGAREGWIDFRGHRVWYAVVGDLGAAQKLPLLCLHGGPGLGHDYLEPLAALASGGRPVVFYDQLGCGNSDQPDDPILWTVPLFVEEIGVVRQALGLERLHLLGQSWGGMLAMEYLVTQPRGIASATIASAPGSMRELVTELKRLRADLPAAVQAIVLQNEANGTTDSAEYQDAMRVFSGRHFCRLDPWPEPLARSFAKLERNPQVSLTMYGASELDVVGNLRDWDIIDRLAEIAVPTLVTSGRHDQITPSLANSVHRGIRGSEWVIFENSSHVAHLEEPARYAAVIEELLSRHETG